MRWPDAEVVITETLVRELLKEQHPDLSACLLIEAESGWDNANWRLGDSLQLRLPRRASAAPLLRHEQRWLPELAPGLTLPVPVQVRRGVPSTLFPWPWSIVPWFDATPGNLFPPFRSEDVAASLATFIKSLHQPAPSDAPVNAFRGVPLQSRTTTFEERLSTLATDIDGPGVRHVWRSAIEAEPWKDGPVWIHGDLHPANLLFNSGSLFASH